MWHLVGKGVNLNWREGRYKSSLVVKRISCPFKEKSSVLHWAKGKLRSEPHPVRVPVLENENIFERC